MADGRALPQSTDTAKEVVGTSAGLSIVISPVEALVAAAGPPTAGCFVALPAARAGQRAGVGDAC